MASPAELTPDQGRFGFHLGQATPRVWVTHAIIALNVLVFAAMLIDGAGLFQPDSAVHLRWGANFGPITKEGEWWRLASSMFIHFGVLHVAMNMWALWCVGTLVERLYGNGAFVALYLFAGLTGSFASLLWNADRVVSAGASGAIFGVYGALGAYLLRQPGSVPQSVLKSLRGSTIAFIAYSIALGAVVSAIDNAAHAGGLAGGFALGWLLARPLQPRPTMSVGRVFLAAAFGAAAMVALYAAVPPPAYSYAAHRAAIAAIRQFATEEEALAKKAGALVEARKAGRISDRELGEGFGKDVVPGWIVAHARFNAVHLEPGSPAASKLRALTDYTRVRRDMFAGYAAGLQTGDEAKLRHAAALSAESQRLMQAMRDPNAAP